MHRDIKPDNILLENAIEKVKITDFGLARTTDDSSITSHGHIAGTPEYMSPEQARGNAVDSRSDLFSLGCVLHEMATGRSPFKTESPLASMRMVCDHYPEEVSALNQECPRWFSRLVKCLMSKHPEDRPPTAKQVADELGRHLAAWQRADRENRDQAKPSKKTNSSSPKRFIQAGAIIVSLLGLIWLFITQFDQHKQNLKPVTGTDTKLGVAALDSFPFMVLEPSGQTLGFETLDAAVTAAASGAIVELRFDGEYVLKRVDLGTNALVLRAGVGYQPVLKQQDTNTTMINTRAPLLLEGLTLRCSANLVDTSIPLRLRRHRGAGVWLSGSSFMAAHCRFEMTNHEKLTLHDPPSSILLEESPQAQFYSCHFQNPQGSGITYNLGATSPTEPPRTLLVENCAVNGLLVSSIGPYENLFRFAMTNNTIAGPSICLLIYGHKPNLTHVEAQANLFDVDHLILLRQRLGPDRPPIARLLSWQGKRNGYSIAKHYIDPWENLQSWSDWTESNGISEDQSLALPLGIRNRLDESYDAQGTAGLSDGRLTEDEITALKKITPDPNQRVGADWEHLGPGEAYDRWRASPNYEPWLESTRALLANP